MAMIKIKYNNIECSDKAKAGSHPKYLQWRLKSNDIL